MKSNSSILILSAVLVFFASCQKEIQFTEDNWDTAFKVSSEVSKAALQTDGSVIFNAGDSIRLQGKYCHAFTTSSTGSTVNFTGNLGGDDAASFLAFYPYGSYSSSEEGDSYNVTIPHLQTGVKDSFDPSAAVMVGRTSGESIRMKNVVALVKFTLSTSDITSVTLHSVSSVGIAGTVSVSVPESDVPQIGAADIDSVLMVPSGKTFEPGDYYIAVAPASLPSGLKLKFTRSEDDATATRTGTSATAFYRSEILKLGDVDTELEWIPAPQKEATIDIPLVFIANPDASLTWPFASPSKVSASYLEGKASYPGVETEFVLPESKGGYVFKIYGTVGIATNSGSRQGLKFGDSQGDYLEAPSIAGYSLTNVKIVAGGSGTNGKLTVVGADGSSVIGGTVAPTFAAAGDSFEWTLYNTIPGAAYRLQVGKGTVKARELHFHYSTIPNYSSDPEENLQNVAMDTIPDFSRVGYHFGDREIPDVPVRITLEAPSDGSDALSMITDAIAKVQTPGAILLKAGTYNVSSTIEMERSGVVLRGEGEGKTVIYCTATTQLTNVVRIGNFNSKNISSECSDIVARYVPVGQMWVPVGDPSIFAVGDKVFVYRKATNEWLDAIHMREIPSSGTDGIEQWSTSLYSIYWERNVTAIDGDKIYLDNPIVMGIGGYGTSGVLYKGSWSRVEECGIENLTIDTRYDATLKSGSDYIDELHAWTGVNVRAAENCWVRNVTTKHIGYCSVNLGTGAYKVTVDQCTGLEPVSQVTGSRRYAFHFSGCQACLIENCHCNDDRHQYVCGSRVPGPNVFYNCTATKTRSEAGPHQRWTTGVLYDNVIVSGELNIHDRADYGTGHGWTSANVVLYNCKANTIVCQRPWASAKNWAIGCIGTHKMADRSYSDALGTRPDGVWISEGAYVSPTSLYIDQLEKRHNEGVWLDK